MFSGKWFNPIGLAKSANAIVQSHQIPDEAYYEMVGKEVAAGQVRQGLWIKAVSEAMGDESKVRPIYIKLRVQSMRQEIAGAIKAGALPSTAENSANKLTLNAEEVIPERVIIECPNCHGRLRVIANKHIEVKCAHCGYEFETHS